MERNRFSPDTRRRVTEDTERFATAIERHREGRLAEAEALYRAQLDEHPDPEGDVGQLLGTVVLQQGRAEEAVAILEQVVESHPDRADAHNNLGVARQALGKWPEAARAFQAAIQADPEYVQAFANLGGLMERRRLFVDAEKCYRHAVGLVPTDVALCRSLARVLQGQERWDDAAEAFRQALAIDDDLDARVGLGYSLIRGERLDEAADVFETVLEARPEFAEIHNNLSYIFERQGRMPKAIEAANRALALKPDYSEAHNNLGMALRGEHRLDEAATAFSQALRLRADFPLAAFNLGTTQLLAGRYLEGWAGYERRDATLGLSPRVADRPPWNGEPLTGGTLFVHADQGFGDTLQFVRFLPAVRSRARCRVILECPAALATLLTGMEGIDELVEEGHDPSNFDAWIPLGSLPGRLGTTLDTLPADVPYLRAPDDVDDTLAAMLRDSSGPRVGLVWRGNPRQARDVVRSCPARHLLPLFENTDVSFFSLQTGEGAFDELANVLPNRDLVVDLGRHLHDFGRTAAVLSRLDLLLTVDTAAAHLAGALGRPVWCMLCHTPDWRWHLDRHDSPWYPTMRLFRQRQWGDWPGVVAEVGEALASFET